METFRQALPGALVFPPPKPQTAPHSNITPRSLTAEAPDILPSKRLSPSAIMAGPTPFRMDPALQNYNEYMKNRWKYFRWTPRVAFVGFMYGIFVPTIMGYSFWRWDGKWDMRGKLRGDTISEW